MNNNGDWEMAISDNILLQDSYGNWFFQDINEGLWLIKYCPFCGQKLDSTGCPNCG